MVARQLASGSGRRWSSEMETSGNAGQRAYTPGRSFRSSRPCRVVTVRSACSAKKGKCIRSRWKWTMSNSCASAMDLVQHRHVRREIGLEIAGIEPDGLIAAGHQLGLGPRFGAGEQGHLVAEVDERIRQVRDDSLRAAIKSRRHRLVQRRNLSDPHSSGPTRAPALPEADINISYPITKVEVTSLHQVDHSNQRMNIPHVPLVAGYSFALSECWRSVSAVFTSR